MLVLSLSEQNYELTSEDRRILNYCVCVLSLRKLLYLPLMMQKAMRVAVTQLARTTDINTSRYCNSTPPATDII